jgi:hypothetical protein
MPRFLKAGVPVDAVLADGSDAYDEMKTTFGHEFSSISSYDRATHVVSISTSKGILKAKSGDWVVRDPGSEIKVLDDATFDKQYDMVD